MASKTVALYDGGQPKFKFPAHDSTRDFGCMLPTTVAGEYNRGSFTLGNILQPAAHPYQRDALARLKKTDNPVSVALLVVPELHAVTQLFVRTEPKAPIGSDCCRNRGDTMQGVTFDVFAKLVDTTKCDEFDTIEALIDSGEDFPLPAGFTDIDANAENVFHAFLDTSTTTVTTTEVPSLDPLVPDTNTSVAVTTTASGVFIPVGKTLVLGVKLKTLPTGIDGTYHAMQGRIALVTKVDNFEYPIHK